MKLKADKFHYIKIKNVHWRLPLREKKINYKVGEDICKVGKNCKGLTSTTFKELNQ